MASDPFLFPPEFGECVFCEQPCTIPVLCTGCCDQPCHLGCSINWKRNHPPLPCPVCRQYPSIRECLFCLQPNNIQYTFTRCCQQTCHEQCGYTWTQDHYPPRPCLYCRQPLSTLTVDHQPWRKDPHFVEQVKEPWKDNPFWYCTYRKGKDTFQGFFGELKDPNETTRTIHFLGYTQSEVIPHMKNILSSQ